MGRDVDVSQPAKRYYAFNSGMCMNCERLPAEKRGRCNSCYQYHKRNGKERPRKLYKRKPLAKWCKRCGSLNVRAADRCTACYQYRKANGKERPTHLFDKDARCKNCGIPYNTLPNRRPQKAGHCAACYDYQKRTGNARPRHLWGDGPQGWCECGCPAVALVEGMPVCNRHKE